MPSVSYDALRDEITMDQVLKQLGFEPARRQVTKRPWTIAAQMVEIFPGSSVGEMPNSNSEEAPVLNLTN